VKIVSVVGARPQFIKAFAVSRELQPDHEEIMIHTGQHYDEEMSDIFFEELEMAEPNYNLGVGSDTHGRQTAAMLESIEEVIMTEKPDLILVYGDTNSTLAGAIAGSKLEPLVAHVEAGLRSYNQEMPEETNRVLTDHASDILFAPSSNAAETLCEENIWGRIHNVGDVMYDAILWARKKAPERTNTLDRLGVTAGEYILATVHRASNTNNKKQLAEIIDGLSSASIPVVLPAHPRTEEYLKKYGLWKNACEQLQVTDPMGYLDFVRMIDGAERVATDSGGVQKEAFYLDTPCITLREETEWTETIESGWNRLVSPNADKIQDALITEEWPDSKPRLYGDGEAASKIVETLECE